MADYRKVCSTIGQEAAEASLEAHYGKDVLGDFYRGDITLRKLRVLLEGLPPDAPAFWLETPNGARSFRRVMSPR